MWPFWVKISTSLFSRSRGQRRHQATTPHSPQPPPLTAFNTRIHQQKPAPQPTGITISSSLASPQPPAHLRSTSAPISNRSPLPRLSRSKPDASLQSSTRTDAGPILPRSRRAVVASSSGPLAPIVLTPSQKEVDSTPRSPLPRLRQVQREEAHFPAQHDEVRYTRSVSPAPSGQKSPSPKTIAYMKQSKRSVSLERGDKERTEDTPPKAKSKAFPRPIRSKKKKSTSYSWLQDKKNPVKSPKPVPHVPPQSSNMADREDKKEDYSYYSSSSSSSSETPPPVALSTTAKDTLSHIAKFLMTKAQDPNISISDFAAYLTKNSLEPLPPTAFQTEKPYKVLVISGCSKSAKSTVSNLILSFFKAQRATTSSNKYYKYVADERGRLGFNILIFSNDEFRTTDGLDIDWNRMRQSLNSVTQNTPGLSLVIIEGHRLYQNQGIIELAQYISTETERLHT